MILVQGRILDPPEVCYKDESQVKPIRASWNINERQFHIPGNLRKWSVLVLGNATFHSDHSSMRFRGALTRAGMTVGIPSRPQGGNPNAQAYHVPKIVNMKDHDFLLKQAFRKIKGDGIEMLFVILPDKGVVNYSRVKYWADLHAGKLTIYEKPSILRSFC